MTTNLAAASITVQTATGAVTDTFANRLGDIINVKRDFGAKGDGTTDDTAAIQAAFNAAFGTAASPHGNTNRFLNKTVFFPAGSYRVGAAITSGDILTLTAVKGGTILGNGGESTRIFYGGTGSGSTIRLIHTNGFDECYIYGLSFEIAGTNAIGFSLDWDNIQPVLLSANTFANCVFSGSGSTDGSTGLLIGETGFQGDQTLILNCNFYNWTHAGVKTANANALLCSIICCAFDACGNDGSGASIYCSTGSISFITDGSFGRQGDNTSSWHVKIVSGPTHINGCRCEGPNFAKLFDTAVVSGCAHQPVVAGTMFDLAGGPMVSIDGCIGNSLTSMAAANTNSIATVKDSLFDNRNFFTSFTGTISLENVVLGGTGMGSLLQNQTVTLGTTRTFGIEAAALTDVQFLYDSYILHTSGATFTVIIATGVFTLASHGFIADTSIAFTTTGALPTGLSINTTYYVIATGLSTNNFKVSTTKGGAAVNTTGTQSGTHTLNVVRNYVKGDQVLKSNVAAGGSPGWICTTSGPAVADTGAAVAVFKALANVAA